MGPCRVRLVERTSTPDGPACTDAGRLADGPAGCSRSARLCELHSDDKRDRLTAHNCNVSHEA